MTARISVDVSRWTLRNVWRRGRGLCVRPGIRRILDANEIANDTDADSPRSLVGGFTEQNPRTGEIWHYLFHVSASSSAPLWTGTDLRLSVFEEDLTLFSELSIGNVGVPRGISRVVVEGQILICSPDFPTMWGLVGSALRIAEAQPSISGFSVLDVPRGIACRWGNRPVIASGASLFVGDPVSATGGDLRTFIAANQNNRPGIVYGLHEAAGGMLVVATSAGVWGIDSSAAAVGVVGSNGADWRAINHHHTVDFDGSCAVRGRVYALTRRGYALVDVEDGREWEIGDPDISRALADGIDADDFRTARLYGGDEGPIVALDPEDAAHFSDTDAGITSWWTSDVARIEVRGTLRDVDGAQILILPSGLFRVGGNVDDTAPSANNDPVSPVAVLSGELEQPTSIRRVVRRVDFAAAIGGSTEFSCSVRGQAARSVVGAADPDGLTEGSSSWGDERFTSTPIASARFDFDDDVEPSIEIGIQGGGARISHVISVEVVDIERPGAEG